MNISLNDAGALCVSMEAQEGLKAGDLCKITGNCKVGKAAAGDVAFGLVKLVRDGVATVQVEGYAKLPYSGTAPGLGYTTLAADNAGGMKSVSTGGKAYFVCEVDTTAGRLGLLL